MKLQNLTTREVIALTMTLTIFLVLMLHAVGMIVAGPERVNDKGREIFGNVIFSILGMLSAFMAQALNGPPPPPTPPETKP